MKFQNNDAIMSQLIYIYIICHLKFLFKMYLQGKSMCITIFKFWVYELMSIVFFFVVVVVVVIFTLHTMASLSFHTS